MCVHPISKNNFLQSRVFFWEAEQDINILSFTFRFTYKKETTTFQTSELREKLAFSYATKEVKGVPSHTRMFSDRADFPFFLDFLNAKRSNFTVDVLFLKHDCQLDILSDPLKQAAKVASSRVCAIHSFSSSLSLLSLYMHPGTHAIFQSYFYFYFETRVGIGITTCRKGS